MKNTLLNAICLAVLLGLHSCGLSQESVVADAPGYPRWVGDIAADETLDDPEFVLCLGEDQVKQYFNFGNGLQYTGEQHAILTAFREQYQPVPLAQSGMIRIRFIVNCRGDTGRFRIIASDNHYQPMAFDRRITDQLLEITRSLDGWKIQSDGEIAKDYYQYLLFKIENGALKEVLP
ncbi:hypothetical protein [Flavilitoribacter nigricans]|uniref:hypothetical protein n=1 Tax=Flavilitoribacter nigricans TaxID=70997 RepID=UPI00117A3ADF|nr:hypothetical protein [Flavilitoribacter nigricans]